MRLAAPALSLLAVLGLWGCQMSPSERVHRAKDAVYDKKPSLALRQYRLALDGLEHDDSPSANVLRAKALRGTGDVYYLELHDIRQAVATYKELITQCPEAPETMDARVMLAEILRTYYRDLRGAIAELDAALARNPPQSAELRYQVAKLYFELGDYQQAELEAEKLLMAYETSPLVADAMFLIAQALGMREGMHADAAKAYEALIERFPEAELAPHALFELGKLKAEGNENDEAIAIWVKALKRHPDPKVVQQAIARVRKRITQTTPTAYGQHAAFERGHARDGIKLNHKTSVEAVGGTAEEAKHDYGD
jgi:tetratricopeptide (TPR) repeat protein